MTHDSCSRLCLNENIVKIVEEYHTKASTRAIFFEFLSEKEMKLLLRRDMKDEMALEKAKNFLRFHNDLLSSKELLSTIVYAEQYKKAHQNAAMLVQRATWTCTSESHNLFPYRVRAQIFTLLMLSKIGPSYMTAVAFEVWNIIFKIIAEDTSMFMHNLENMNEKQVYDQSAQR